jgi:putative acetyltransferase
VCAGWLSVGIATQHHSKRYDADRTLLQNELSMLCNKLIIRHSTANDMAAIRAVETGAFGRKAEAALVEQLIPAPETTISLIALCDGKAVGHLLLTEIEAPVKALALAPLAVLPSYREMQVGSELVRSAIREAGNSGYQAIFVLGDNMYYERFGFVSRLADPFEVEWQGINFMALEVEPGCLKGKKGLLSYPAPFLQA